MVSLDLETTHPNPLFARIVSGTVALVGGGEPTEHLSVLANPGVEIPQGAIDVHGITNERARADGVAPADALGELLWALGSELQPGRALIVFNARYDLTVLDREARRHGLSSLLCAIRCTGVVDPLTEDRFLDRYRADTGHKLDAVCRNYGAPLDRQEGEHDAAADAVGAARLAWVMAEKGKVIRRTDWPAARREAVECRDEWLKVRHDLPALHRAQRRWARDQGENLAEYWDEVADVWGEPWHRDRAQMIREECRWWPVIPSERVQLMAGRLPVREVVYADAPLYSKDALTSSDPALYS